MKTLLTKRRQQLQMIDTLMILIVDLLIWALSEYDVGSLKINGSFSWERAVLLWCLLVAFRCLFSVYNSIWRYANVTMYLKLMFADMLAAGAYLIIGHFVVDLYLGFAYTVLFFLAELLATLYSRFMYQHLYSLTKKISDEKKLKSKSSGDVTEEGNKVNIAIVGAGNVGATLADELNRNPKAYYRPYCFIDTDNAKIGAKINGIMVYREDDSIVDAIKSMPVQEIIIALPDISKENRERLYNLYSRTGCKVKLYDYPTGENRGKEESGKRILRDFSIEDLLFRDPLKVKSEKTKAFYTDKVVLVTGGGGSIGSELCRQIAKLKPKQLVILDIYENNAYDIQQELIRKYGIYDEETGEGLNLRTIIASVRDVEHLDEIFNEIRPQIVFHAAAHKHVPLMEDSGCEAIKNNVFGTYNVANMAEKYGVEKFLLISTDKAVNPTNIMGASKRLCEMVVQCRKDSKTEFTAVRFGNVLGSNGSVIPLFKRQIEAGGPITLTDRRIIRYFMTIPEAVGLVMETCCMAKNGELFVLDMGKPVRILDLAENMVRLSGLTPYEDIDIVEVGLRPGEKLYEELLMKTEELVKTENQMIFIERDTGLPRNEVEEKLSILRGAVATDMSETGFMGHHDKVLNAIRSVVPTFHDPVEVNAKAGESKEMQNARQIVKG